MPRVTGSFTAAGQSSAESFRGRFNLTLSGTFVATVRAERSFDDGATWHPLTSGGSSVTFSAPCTEVLDEPEGAVLYRLNCTSYTSGTVTYRLSQ